MVAHIYIAEKYHIDVSMDLTKKIGDLIKEEKISELIRLLNENFSYKFDDQQMIGTYAFADLFQPVGKKPPAEPKGTFKPNILLFKCLQDTDIIVKYRYSENYLKEFRAQTVPLPL